MSRAHDHAHADFPGFGLGLGGDVDCSEMLLRLYQFIDAEMTDADCVRFRSHLDECPECLSEYERDLVLKLLVRRSCVAQPAPVQLRLQILASITRLEFGLAPQGHEDALRRGGDATG